MTYFTRGIRVDKTYWRNQSPKALTWGCTDTGMEFGTDQGHHGRTEQEGKSTTPVLKV